jgi:hypothetical protein
MNTGLGLLGPCVPAPIDFEPACDGGGDGDGDGDGDSRTWNCFVIGLGAIQDAGGCEATIDLADSFEVGPGGHGGHGAWYCFGM